MKRPSILRRLSAKESSETPTLSFGTSEPPHSDFERVVVSVLYRDRQTVILETSGDLKIGNRIAMNNAYMLLLPMQSNDDQGGGHSHHGHSH